MSSRRNAAKLMVEMVKMIKPLKLQMLAAITLGVIGFILSFGIGIIGGYAMLSLLPDFISRGFVNLPFGGYEFSFYIKALVVCAILRGVFHYVEQYCNHYIAFRILAEIRGQIFSAMRRLAPAKLEGENPGKLISLIMGDIELLEVFYAHTISPIMIAFFVTIVLAIFFINIHPLIALVAIASYITIGVIVPYIASAKSKDVGVNIRKNIGYLNGKFLDELRGIREVIQYDAGNYAIQDIENTTEETLVHQLKLKEQVASLQGNTDTIIIVFSVIQALVCTKLAISGAITPSQGFIAVLTQMSTFGPCIALANLGVTLTQTLACGDRVMNLLEEKPMVEKVKDGVNVDLENIALENVEFAYDNVKILDNINLEINKGETLGIMGKSGSGKSTILKLLMRFWDPQKGTISVNGINLRDINTDSIYDNIDYMTQTTILFAGTIRDNLKIAKQDATDQEINEALKKASIYEYISGLDNGLNTRVSELGDNFSGGERQRIGLARCFLTDSKLLLLDEPTSNLDSHNEAIILKSLIEGIKDKAIVLVSHRESTMGVCDRVIKMSELMDL
ncbi:amino acid ABC transporter ATP-binding/permease protein [Peptostreptococcus canis]|uniref:ABC transporter ATP-binding protein n=1 Tax=Peptostreptococcus canis TaxID=1159213 RepID=A0ABR6TMG9_9FIRM|nr:ABC transporter ATP-binding protein [Peptostreptococcus canis]MBC2576612.1 ABC transporter ATP-binding protein [Peptostreptococcus canis]MBP1998799.1 ATP-binding cassette subfamily C protein [Peptostreptococcus canis]